MLTDSSGTVEEHNSYRPYGAIQTHTGTSDEAYKYTGQKRDASTELYFYQARYYAQGLGRFVSPDPLVPDALDPQAFNRYAYGRNNPMRYTDPTGYWWWDDWGNDWGNWGSWDAPGFGGGYWNPPVGPIDNPVTGVPTFRPGHVVATPLPPESWFPDPFGRDPWGLDSWLNDSLLAAVLSEVDELQLVVGIGGTIGGNPSLERDLPGLFLHAEVNVGFAVNVGSLLDSRFFVSAQISPMIGLGYYGGLGWQGGIGGFTRLTPGGYSQSVSAHAEGGHGRGPSLSGGVDFPVRRPDPYSASLTVDGAALIKGRGGIGYGTYGAVGPGFNFTHGSPTLGEMWSILQQSFF